MSEDDVWMTIIGPYTTNRRAFAYTNLYRFHIDFRNSGAAPVRRRSPNDGIVEKISM